MQIDKLKLIQALKARIAETKRDDRKGAIVGYTGAHALALHEMTPKHKGEPRPSGLGVRWGPSLYGSQFLLGPAREFAQDVAGVIADAAKAGKRLAECLYTGGLLIQRQSMLRVPVEYGDLKRSAFTAKE